MQLTGAYKNALFFLFRDSYNHHFFFFLLIINLTATQVYTENY